MCGIAAIISSSPSRQNFHDLLKLMLSVEERGKDAAGIGYITRDGRALFIKEGKPASEIVGSLRKSSQAIGLGLAHTRKKTLGDPADNDNNHPIIHDGMMLIHNGSITQSWSLEQSQETKIKGMVDSRVILAQIADELKQGASGQREALERALAKIGGTYAIAFVDSADPNRLFLARNTNPIELAYDTELGVIYAASTQQALKDLFCESEIQLNGFKQYSRMGKIAWLSLPVQKGMEIIRTKDGSLKWDFFDVKEFVPVQQPIGFKTPATPVADLVRASEMIRLPACRGGNYYYLSQMIASESDPVLLSTRHGLEEMDEQQIRKFLQELVKAIDEHHSLRSTLQRFFHHIVSTHLSITPALGRVRA